MKRIGATAVATLAATLIVTATAGAFPVFTATPEGGTAISTTKTVLQTVGGKKISCRNDTSSYRVRSTEVVEMYVELFGCESGKLPCASNEPFSGWGTISFYLEGALVYLDAAQHKAGLRLRIADHRNNGPLETFCWGGPGVRFAGAAVGSFGPLNRLVQPGGVFPLKLKQSSGKQALTSYEGDPEETTSLVTLGEGSEQAGLTLSLNMTFNGALEIAG